jgi:regulatory protein
LLEIDSDAELEAAKELAVARMSRMADLEQDVRSRRIAGYLSRKGYASNVVWAAIKFATDSLAK